MRAMDGLHLCVLSDLKVLAFVHVVHAVLVCSLSCAACLGFVCSVSWVFALTLDAWSPWLVYGSLHAGFRILPCKKQTSVQPCAAFSCIRVTS